MEQTPSDGGASAQTGSLGERPGRPGYVGLSVGMEQHLYRLLGRLLGLLEAMATDVTDPIEGRQRTWLQEALDSGHELKEHIEALSFLAAPEPQHRLVRAPYSVRRLVEHAVRAAGWLASERGVSLVLPRLERWAERLVDVDVRAVDRVIRGLSEHLLIRVVRGGAVHVELSEVDGGVHMLFSTTSDAPTEAAPAPSELLVTAWSCIAALHHGRVELLPGARRAELWLPLCGG